MIKPAHYISLMNKKTNMPTVYILSGIPTSGKSTWAKEFALRRFYQTYKAVRIISRDNVRMKLFDLKKYDDYKFTKENEDQVTDYCNGYLQKAIEGRYDIVVDNTHCQERYIDFLIKAFEEKDYEIKIKFFTIPLWKAWLRNKKRSKEHSKSIPWKAILQMRKNFKKINQKKYAKYTV